MASFLNALSLALSIAGNDPSAHDGRAAWRDYAWQQMAFQTCLAVDDAGLCHAYHEKWDWKRDQWIDFLYGIDAKGKMTARLRMTNKDRGDDDYVCFTALFEDAAGRDVFVMHQNWHMDPKQTREKSYDFKLAPAAWQKVSRVVIGSKQCRDGATEDDDVFDAVKARIGQK